MTTAVPPRLDDAFAAAVVAMADPGDHWTGAERLAAARLTRAVFAERHRPPWLRSGPDIVGDAAIAELGDGAADAVTTLAADARRIDREWAATTVEAVGAGPYVELVAIVASMAVIDAFAEALGTDPPPLPARPEPGAPTRPGRDALGYDVADIGAYVPMRVPWTDANVGRALTLSPAGNALYRPLAMACYHDGGFYDLAWNRPLTRPQTEVLATAVSAANECFY